MGRILVIDDDQQLLLLIKKVLEKDDHIVEICHDSSTLDVRQCGVFDLMLVDIMMPSEDGFAFVQRIRSMVNCPILFLTAKSNETDVIYGFGVGGDDYIKKPFNINELRARVNAHLRRSLRKPSTNYCFGNIHIDMLEKKISVNDTTIDLTAKEYQICEFLALHNNQVFSKDDLYDSIFGLYGNASQSTISEHIKNIRAKFKPVDINPINTVWGVGYKWNNENQ